jgi:chromosome segregation protein
MYLEEISIYGFKTFRNETRLKLSPRITAIVGPNGSGKSNIVDAVRWALGEHRLTLLRAASATDLIFSGSSFKKPLSVASVKLIFNNEDRTFPSVSTPRVIIERRIYRSKDSHYFLNGEELRLQDVFSLFYSAGMYNQTYSIVSQGRVDEILLAKPEQKRALIEQVAGVSVFKKKRKDALKKLDETEQNLLRVKDILNELRKKAERIINESKKAHMYYFLQDRLKQLEGTLLNYSLTNIRREIDALKSAIKDSELEEEEIVKKMRTLKEELQKEKDKNSGFIKSLGELRKKEEELKIELAKLEEKEVFQTKKREEIEKQIAELNANADSLERKMRYLENEKKGVSEKISALKKEIEDRKNEIARLKENLKELNDRMAPLAEKERNAEKKREELGEKRIVLERKLSGIKAYISNIESEKRRIEALVQSVEKIDEHKAFRLEEEINALKGEIENTENKANSLREEIALLKYKISEVKSFVNSASSGSGKYGKGTLGEMIGKNAFPGIEEELRRFVANDLDEIKGKKNGGFFVRKNLIEIKVAESEKVKPLKIDEPGFLQGIYVADDIFSASEFFRENAEKIFIKKILTKDGFVFYSPFEVKVSTAILVEEKTKLLKEMEETLRKKTAAAQEFSAKLNNLKRKLSDLIKEYSSASQDAERKKKALEKKKLLRSLSDKIAEKTEEAEKVKKEIEKLKSEISSFSASDESRHLRNEIEKLKSLINGKLFALKDKEYELKRLIETESSFSGRIKGAVSRKEEIEKRISELETDLKIVKQELFSIEKRRNKIKLDIAEIEKNKEAFEEKEKDFENEFKHKNLELERLAEQREEVLRKTEKQRVKLAQKEAQAQAIIEKMKEKEIKEREILYKVDEKKLRIEIASVKAKINALGAIDFTSVGEEEAIKEELEKKESVYNDVSKAKKELEKFIKEMEERAKREFEKTLSGVEKHFALFFRKMFRGGEATIERITNEKGEISGIELNVRLPGKRKQSLPLLSGGEKSLTALAFLFAIFKVKPAPFYILDEVDAALDEENVVRFGELLSEEADFAQFIVITHNKETMQRADMLYGVTMEEDGVSKTVSLKLV